MLEKISCCVMFFFFLFFFGTKALQSSGYESCFQIQLWLLHLNKLASNEWQRNQVEFNCEAWQWHLEGEHKLKPQQQSPGDKSAHKHPGGWLLACYYHLFVNPPLVLVGMV